MNRNTRLVAVLAVALLAATVASFVVYRALAAGSGVQQPQTIDTLVAAKPIPAGTMLTRDYVKVVQWPASSRLDGSLSDPRTVIEVVARRVDMGAGVRAHPDGGHVGAVAVGQALDGLEHERLVARVIGKAGIEGDGDVDELHGKKRRGRIRPLGPR